MNDLMTNTIELKNITINLNYGEIYFTNGETFSAVYENMPAEDFEIKEEGDCLSIQDKRKETFVFLAKNRNSLLL